MTTGGDCWQVEQLEKKLQEAQNMSTGNLGPPVRVPPTPPKADTEKEGSVQLEKKSGWLYKKGGMLNAAYQKRYFVLQDGVLTWYASEPTTLSEGAPQHNGWISCCGLEIETDAGKNVNGRSCFTTKALSGSTRRRIEFACDTVRERHEWVLALKQLQPVRLPLCTAAPKVLFARVLAQIRLQAGSSPLLCPRHLALARPTRAA